MDGRAGPAHERPEPETVGDTIVEEHASLASDRTSQRAQWLRVSSTPRRTQYIGVLVYPAPPLVNVTVLIAPAACVHVTVVVAVVVGAQPP
jgi:hypothetical protein